MRIQSWAMLLLSLLASSACDLQDSGSSRASLPAGPGVSPIHQMAWKAELLDDRAEKDEEFATSETSPMAGSQYLKSEPTEQTFLIRQDGSFALVYEERPEAVLTIIREDDLWHWQMLLPGLVCRTDDAVVPSGSSLEGPATFALEEFRLRFYPSADRVTFIVFDPQREELQGFEHLLYFPPTPKFAVHARLLPFAEPQTIEVVTSRNLKKTFYRYAEIQFRLDGREQRLTALKYALSGESAKDLFIPFRDATTGKETYGAGRFLELEEPEEDFFVLDFNRAFNPLCNYSPAYNCALPPKENRLEVPILAGEKTYPH